MAMAEKGRSTSKKTRHINARYFFIKDRIETGDIDLQYLTAEDMIADVLPSLFQESSSVVCEDYYSIAQMYRNLIVPMKSTLKKAIPNAISTVLARVC